MHSTPSDGPQPLISARRKEYCQLIHGKLQNRGSCVLRTIWFCDSLIGFMLNVLTGRTMPAAALWNSGVLKLGMALEKASRPEFNR